MLKDKIRLVRLQSESVDDVEKEINTTLDKLRVRKDFGWLNRVSIDETFFGTLLVIQYTLVEVNKRGTKK